ncbi:hypothetical protein [Streptosporangium lutulentum]|uniref:DUF5666 domain-containing protein n=1 Tax=Streptosporangium lutulentum TaxID=1461250 RepID=A0ABT9QRW7_9ACTN|nr:hypothetical protein [Streptosporangium lutulentum]MDP9849490.1 hypothetical protein [Streptosporangium lutulentum]
MEPGTYDEPIGRRLRPEESAVTQPQTGFLGSGWSAESELSDPVWPKKERRSGGRTKMTLLAVAAVAVVLGGTVVGVQVMTSPAGSSTDCPPGGCVVAASNQPAPQAETTEPDGEPTEPDGEPALAEEPEEEQAKGETVPTPEATRRGGAATSDPSPTRVPKATRAPRPTTDATADDGPPAGSQVLADEPEPVDEPEPAGRPERADSSPEPSRSPVSVPLGDDGPQAPTQPPVDNAPEPAQPSEAPAPDGAAAIKVGVDLVRDRALTYTVRVVVTADESLSGLRLSLPVNGKVSSVGGAGGKQVGDTLVIESGKNLKAGEKLVVDFTAYGRAELPRTCESSQGECSVA